MSQNVIRRMSFILLFCVGVAQATPVLPSSTVASEAVHDVFLSLAQDSVDARVTAAQAATVAANRAEAIAAATTTTNASSVASYRSRANTAVVRATAYNSFSNQTDSSPFITATGTRTRPGVVALSRDLLNQFPYGTRIMIEDLSGRYNYMLRGRVFIVEDTMARRKNNSLDIWMSTRSEALNWGARSIRITAVR